MNNHQKYHYRCTHCGATYETDRLAGACYHCMKNQQQGQLIIEYNLAQIRKNHNIQNIIDGFADGFFADLMPFDNRETLSAWYNYMSPLRKLQQPQNQRHNIFVKDESLFPTGYFNRIGHFMEAYYGKQLAIEKQGIFNPIAIEAAKIIGYEIFVQLDFKLPQKIFINQKDSILLMALIKAAYEMEQLRLTNHSSDFFVLKNHNKQLVMNELTHFSNKMNINLITCSFDKEINTYEPADVNRWLAFIRQFGYADLPNVFGEIMTAEESVFFKLE